MTIFAKAYPEPEIEPAPLIDSVQGPTSSPEGEGGFFNGVLSVADAVRTGFMSAQYEALSTIQTLAAGTGIGDEDYRARLEEAARLNFETARNEYQPDPEKSSQAAQIVHSVTNGITKYVQSASLAALPGVGGAGAVALTSGTFGLNMGATRYQELLSKGVDAETAQKGGMFSAASNAFWSAVPGAFGWNLASRVSSGAGLAVFGGANETATIRTILDNADYSSAAEYYDPTNPLDLFISAVMGGVAGAGSHIMLRGKDSPPKTDETVSYHTKDGRGVSAVQVEDAARALAEQRADEANLPVDLENGEQVAKAREAQRTVDRQFTRKQAVQAPADSVDVAKLEAVRKASLERLAKRAAASGKKLQNRDRSSKESIAQMNSIASSPDYLRLSSGPFLSDGAPVVTDAGDIPQMQRGNRLTLVDAKGQRYQAQYAVVDADTVLTSNAIDGTPNELYGVDGVEAPQAVAGNGRITALNEAYNRGSAGQYRAEFTADPQHGIDQSVIAGMERPILVRLVDENSLPPDIGDRTNQRSTADLNYIEQAVQDSERIDLSRLEFTEDGNISPETTRQFVNLLPESERGQLVVNGVPTDAASRRLDAAIFQAAYKSPGLTQLLDSSNMTPGVGALLRALRVLAPRVLQLPEGGDLDFRPYIAEVLNEVNTTRASGKRMKIAEIAAQGAYGRSPEAQAFLDFLGENETKGGGSKEVLRVFSELTDFARRNQDQMEQGESLFGAAPKFTRLDLMRQFEKLSGTKIDESEFKPSESLNDVAVQAVDDEIDASVRRAEQERQSQRVEDERSAAASDVEEEASPGLFDVEEATQSALARGVEAARIEAVVRANVDDLHQRQQESSIERRTAMMAIDDDPNLRLQIDEGDTTMNAAEYMRREEDRADAVAREAESVDVAVVCAYLNGGLDG